MRCTRIPLGCLAGLLLCWTALPAAAQAPQAAKPPVTPAQAQAVLDVLKDDKRRAEFTATLEGMTQALPAAAPATALPLEPDSLGEQLLVQVSGAIAAGSAQLAATVRTVNDLPLLWRWVASTATDPAARARIMEAAWRLLLVLMLAGAAEFAVARLLRKMRAVLGAWAPQGSDPVAEIHAAEAEAEPDPSPHEPGPAQSEARHAKAATVRRRTLSRALGTLKRLPYLLGRLLLDLVPFAAFGAVAAGLMTTPLGADILSRGVVVLVVQAYVGARALLATIAMLVTPEGMRLRLLHVSDTAAVFLTRWARRIVTIGVTGAVIAEVGLVFGMYRTAHDALLKLFALVVHGCAVVMVLQARAAVARRIRQGNGSATGPGVWPALRQRIAAVWHLIAIFYIVALWLVWAVELRNGYVRLIQFFLVTSAVIVTARIVAVLALGALDRLRPGADLAARHPGLEARTSFYYPFLRGLVTIVIVALTGFSLLEVWGLGAWSWLMRTGLGGRVVSAAGLIGVTVLLAVLIWEGANAAVEQHLARLTAQSHLARAGRLRTLLPMLRTTLMVTIVLVVGLMVLSELGVNIAPLLAGAGVIGIAVGFGSQKLVQDLITGLFLLLENAMQVGDVVTLGGLTGTVEALSIRTIRLRALDGSVHIIPFSAVTTVTNQTRDYGFAVVDVSVGLNEEPGRISDVVRGVASEMRSDPRWATVILEPLDVMGVERFIDTAWVLRVRLKTQPASRWSVGRELNRRIKVRFDELAIESPFTSYRVLSGQPAATATEEAA